MDEKKGAAVGGVGDVEQEGAVSGKSAKLGGKGVNVG
jgi:hypothetical protein